MRINTENAPPITPAQIANIKIEGADVLMVGREQPAGEETRMVIGVTIAAVPMDLDRVRFPLVSHQDPLELQLPAGAAAATCSAASSV